jgi:hypothetical protein
MASGGHAMPRHGHAIVMVSSRDGGKWWHWCWEVSEGSRVQWWLRLDQVQSKNSVWAQVLTLPARCLW